MFTALVLVCANGFKSPDTCYYLSHEEFMGSKEECVTVISDSILLFPNVFEFYDEDTNTQWSVTDIRCVAWEKEGTEA